MKIKYFSTCYTSTVALAKTDLGFHGVEESISPLLIKTTY